MYYNKITKTTEQPSNFTAIFTKIFDKCANIKKLVVKLWLSNLQTQISKTATKLNILEKFTLMLRI